MTKQSKQTKSTAAGSISSITPLTKFLLKGFPKDVSVNQIQSFLPLWLGMGGQIKLHGLRLQKQTSSIVLKIQAGSLREEQYKGSCDFLKESKFNDEHVITLRPFKEPDSNKGGKHDENHQMNSFAKNFWKFITIDKAIFTCDRDSLSTHCQEFCSFQEDSCLRSSPAQLKRKEVSTMTSMWLLKLLKTLRADNHTVLIMFLNPEKVS